MTWRERLRDWFRGYSLADVESLADKVGRGDPGSITPLTAREFKALRAGALTLRRLGVG